MKKVWVSRSHYPLPVNKPLILQTATTQVTTSASLLLLSCLMISPLLLGIWFRGSIICWCKAVSSDLEHFGKIITWSSSFNTSEICFHLAPVQFFSLSFTHFPKSIIFFTSELFMWRHQLPFKGIFRAKVFKHLHAEAVWGGRSSRILQCCSGPWLALLVCSAAGSSSTQGHFLPPRNQGLFQTKIDGWNQSAMVLLFPSST